MIILIQGVWISNDTQATDNGTIHLQRERSPNLIVNYLGPQEQDPDIGQGPGPGSWLDTGLGPDTDPRHGSGSGLGLGPVMSATC